jgi:hypothetical protein
MAPATPRLAHVQVGSDTSSSRESKPCRRAVGALGCGGSPRGRGCPDWRLSTAAAPQCQGSQTHRRPQVRCGRPVCVPKAHAHTANRAQGQVPPSYLQGRQAYTRHELRLVCDRKPTAARLRPVGARKHGSQTVHRGGVFSPAQTNVHNQGRPPWRSAATAAAPAQCHQGRQLCRGLCGPSAASTQGTPVHRARDATAGGRAAAVQREPAMLHTAPRSPTYRHQMLRVPVVHLGFRLFLQRATHTRGEVAQGHAW